MTTVTDWEAAIEAWRMNYGIVKGDPMAAEKVWSRFDTGAPVGAVVALGIALDEIERLREQVWTQGRALEAVKDCFCPDCGCFAIADAALQKKGCCGGDEN